MADTKVRVDPQDHERVVTYGGMFDIANGSQVSIEDVKFAALFYEHILVHDGYFYCYGPLFDELVHVISLPKEERAAHWLTRFLNDGLLVPAIRRGERMLPLWKSASDGVLPGRLATVEEVEGVPVFEFVDEVSSAYANWPGVMVDAKTPKFAQVLDHLINTSGNPLHGFVAGIASEPTTLELQPRIRVHAMVDDLCETVRQQLTNPRFRRGDIERLIWRHVARDIGYAGDREFDPRIYQSIAAAVAADPKGVAFPVVAADRLLTLIRTAYEAFHADEYSTVGGLYPRHSQELVSRGLYDSFKALPVAVGNSSREPRFEPLVEGSLDVSRITPDQILVIRNTKEFAGYIRRLALLRRATQGELPQARKDLLGWLTRSYLPKIYEIAGPVVRIGAPVKVLAKMTEWTLGALVAFQTTGAFDIIWIGGHPLLVFVALASADAVADFSDPVQSLYAWAERTYHGRQFAIRNRYSPLA